MRFRELKLKNNNNYLLNFPKTIKKISLTLELKAVQIKIMPN